MTAGLLRPLLACPWCLGKLVEEAGRLRCAQCRAAYRIEGGIPRMMVEEAELLCPFCDVVMEKQPPCARCPACARRFRMDQRVRGRLGGHAEKMDPRECR